METTLTINIPAPSARVRVGGGGGGSGAGGEKEEPEKNQKIEVCFPNSMPFFFICIYLVGFLLRSILKRTFLIKTS